MRREGYELSVGRPRVLYRNDPVTGQRLEPIEEVVIDVDEDYRRHRRREAQPAQGRADRACGPSGGGKQRLVFRAPVARR